MKPEHAYRFIGALVVTVVVAYGVVGLIQILAISPLWTEKGAAWVQAIGSIAAIAVAIRIASSDSRIRRENEHSIAIIAASNSLQGLLKLKQTLEDAIKYLSSSTNGWLYADRLNYGVKILQQRPSFPVELISQLVPLKGGCALKLAKIQSTLGSIDVDLSSLRCLPGQQMPGNTYRQEGLDSQQLEYALLILSRQLDALREVLTIVHSSGKSFPET